MHDSRDTYLYVEGRNLVAAAAVVSRMPMSMQQASTFKVPQTRAELQALVARRDELQQQLRDADDRRVNLAAQLGRTPSEARAPVAERVTALDARITQLERQITQMDAAISTAMADPKLTQGQGLLEPAPAPPGPPSPADVAPPPGVEFSTLVPPPEGMPPGVERALLVGGMSAVILAAITGWIAYRMAVRRFRRSPVGANAAHMSQLQQSVDAIALEVERISENQRYVTKIVNGLGAGAAEPVQQAAAEREPRAR